MANILCIETATTNCSVALSVNGSVIALREDNSKGYSHAEKLHMFIQEVLDEANMSKSDLDAVAVSKGPGSYTGLRIGVSSAKGLCYALDVKLIAIPTLDSLAIQAEGSSDYVVPMLDARRLEVYANVFSCSPTEMVECRETRAENLTEDSFDEYLQKGTVTFIGDGVKKFQSIVTHTNAIFNIEALPSAKQMAALAEVKYQISDTVDVAYFEPYYLKDFIAG